MKKSSGMFLSFLLILFCLWINILRYPKVWLMLSGAEANDQTLEQGVAEELEPLTVQDDTVYSVTEGDELPASHGPTPVMIPVSRQEENEASYFQDVPFTQPVSEETIDSQETSDTQETSVIYPAAGSPGTMVMSRDFPAYVERTSHAMSSELPR